MWRSNYHPHRLQLTIVRLNPDVDRSGVVDMVDVAHIAFIYGQPVATPGATQGTPELYGRIDTLDVALVAFYYGRTI